MNGIITIPQRIILERLLVAPFQCCADLKQLIGQSLGSVNRHMKQLSDLQLIEYIIPPCVGPRNARLGFLTPRGILALAEGDVTQANQIGRFYGTNLTGLAHLLPRLPALHTLQAQFPRLLAACDRAMTHTYNPAKRSFEWSWLRHYQLTFSTDKATYQLWADALFHVKVSVTRALALHGTAPNHLYYTAWLFLDPGVGGVAMILPRLRGLLKLRETPAYWQQRDTFPPIFIQASSDYRASLWLQAMSVLGDRDNTKRLRGIIEVRPPTPEACWPPGANASAPSRMVPNRVTYLTLETGVPTTLDALFFQDLPLASVTPLVQQRTEEILDSTRANTSGTTLSLRPIPLVKRLTSQSESTQNKSCFANSYVVGRIMLEMTRRQLGVLDYVAAHPLIDEGALAEIFALDAKKLRDNHLQPLLRQEVLARERLVTPRIDALLPPVELPSSGMGLYVTQRGWHLLGSLYHQPRRRLTPTTVENPLPAALHQHLDHTVAIYRFFARLVRAAREHETPQLLQWWETGIACHRQFWVGSQIHSLRPDGIGEYLWPQRRMRFWLEMDMGTMGRHELYDKLRGYADYVRSPTIRLERQPSLPVLIIVTSDRSQEERITNVVSDLLSDGHLLASNGAIVIRTTLFSEIVAKGPLGPIWLNQIPPPPVRPLYPGGSVTRSLRLTDALPPPRQA